MPSSISTGTKPRAVGQVLSASCTLEQTQAHSGPSTPHASPRPCTGSVPPPVSFCDYATFCPLCRNVLPSLTKLRFLVIVFLDFLLRMATCIFVSFPSGSEDEAAYPRWDLPCPSAQAPLGPLQLHSIIHSSPKISSTSLSPASS